MILIRFTDAQMEKRGIGYLAGRFSVKTWANGETLVPAEALPCLASEGMTFTVVGHLPYERVYASLRDTAAATV